MTAQLKVFQSQLSSFALQHRASINANPVLRYQFHLMCTSIGVDPLSSHRSLLSSVLRLGDFYYTLALHIAEACMVTQPYNGGLISVSELLQRCRKKVVGRLSSQDVLTAVTKLHCLGGGWAVVELSGAGGGGDGGKMVLSVPSELSVDEVAVLRWVSGAGGRWTVRGMGEGLRWERRRVEDVTRRLVGSGMAWVDAGAGAGEEEAEYWLFSLFSEQSAVAANRAAEKEEEGEAAGKGGAG